jgi:hypothetical protein
MRSTKSCILIFLRLAIFAAMALPRLASAQCGFLSQQFQNTSNPQTPLWPTIRPISVPRALSPAPRFLTPA